MRPGCGRPRLVVDPSVKRPVGPARGEDSIETLIRCSAVLPDGTLCGLRATYLAEDGLRCVRHCRFPDLLREACETSDRLRHEAAELRARSTALRAQSKAALQRPGAPWRGGWPVPGPKER